MSENTPVAERRNIASVAVLIVVVTVAAVFFYSLGRGYLLESDPLYTDLSFSPVYVKNGFAPAYVSVTDPEMTDWDLKLPAGRGEGVLMSKLRQDEPPISSEFLSLGARKTGDYTILIPFTLSGEAIDALHGDKSVSPGIYLAGIGENWEIYINGNAVIKQLYLNTKGEITSFRSQRAVNIPFDKNFLQEGENFLVLHIVGAHSSPYTGLFYSAPYYIGDYTKISNNGEILLMVALCAIYVFLGLYYILLFSLRRTDMYNFLYGIFSSLSAVYFFARSAAIYHMIADTAITQRIEFAALYLMVFVMGAFLENLNFGRVKPVTGVYGLSCAALIVLQCFSSIWFTADLRAVWQVYGPLYLGYVIAYDVLYTLFKQVAAWRGARLARGAPANALFLFFKSLYDRELGNILVLISIVLGTFIVDLVKPGILRTAASLTRYSLFAAMLCLSFMLARKSEYRFEKTEQMNELLETIVRQRTRELEEQVLIARAASRAKSDFLANMSHEIRTPLNAVIGMTTIGAQAENLARKDYAFTKIKEASEHLLGVINDILDMSKIEAGKLDLGETTFSVRDVISRVGNVMRFKADEKKQELAISVAHDLPDAVRGDDLRLAQVLTNLVGNAIKFTPERGRIALTAAFAGEEGGICSLRFLVEDTGIGITEEQKGKLFKSFQQAESSTTRKYGGTGLGLALCRQIVKLMGGEIWVESRPGQGSLFGFTIKAPRASELPQEEEAVGEDLKEGEFQGCVILLAEDVELNREILMALLEPTGVIIEIAENGQQAVEMFEKAPERYRLILMDVQMPIMDGYEASRLIRAGQNPHAASVPIVAMTANVFREDIERSLSCGMNAHLGKPIELDKVLTVLRQYMNCM